MKPHRSVCRPLASDLGLQQIRIDTDYVPDFLRSALQSNEVQEVAAALVKTVQNDHREQPRATPVASPGAPYSRYKTIR
jgi:hypothetical protein